MASRVPTERQMTVRVAIALVLASPFANSASEAVETSAAESDTPLAVRLSPPRPTAVSDSLPANPYAGISNEQLADVADRWDALNQDERRWFFVEVRKRLMATDGAPEIPIGPSARFGQVVRNRDGTVVRIETTRVTAQPAATTGARDDPRAYGLGFERRLEGRAGSEGGPNPANARVPASGHQLPGKPDGGT